jgi:hypothetical protein
MNQDRDYWHQTSAGRVVRIGRSSRNCSLWEIWLDDQYVCDGFDSPEHAARCINERDFDDEATMDLFRGISVPYEMHIWRENRPELWTPNARRYYN